MRKHAFSLAISVSNPPDCLALRLFGLCSELFLDLNRTEPAPHARRVTSSPRPSRDDPVKFVLMVIAHLHAVAVLTRSMTDIQSVKSCITFVYASNSNIKQEVGKMLDCTHIQTYRRAFKKSRIKIFCHYFAG